MQISGRTFWLGVLLLTVLLRLPTLWVEVLDTDEAGHAVHSQVLLDGGTPYVDFIDNKQPLLYATYAAIFAIAGPTLLAVHVVAIPWLVATAWLIALLARAVWRHEWAGRTAALLFTLGSSAYLEKDVLATNTELLMNLPLLGAAWLVLGPLVTADPTRRDPRQLSPARLLLAGALLGIATLYNLKAGILLPVLGLLLLLQARWRGLGQGLVLTLGLLLPWGLTALLFWHAGALEDLIFWNFLLNFKYMDAGVPLWLIDFRRGILYGFPRLLLFLLATSVLWVAAGAALRSPPPDRPARRGVYGIGLWLALSFVPVCMGGRLYGHYFLQLLPPLAVLAAGPLARLYGRPARPVDGATPARRRLLPVAAAIGLLLPVLGLTAAGHVRIARGALDGLQPQVARVADYLRAHTCPDDRIFLWAYWSQVYYYAQRPPASRFVYPQTLAGYVPGHPASLDPHRDTSGYIVPEHWDQLREDFRRHPPELLVDAAPGKIHFWEKYPIDNYPILKKIIDDEYQQEQVIDGVVIYRRRAGRGAPPCPP
ncbi:MAG: hypothetical protein RBU45_14130 [Myxococcota bacterium]|jgi:4-amino-4-deoxy-L-arabinose transferase-like glycosyltransferase|nr:hypothetical protein [Myxococcota bacterium]